MAPDEQTRTETLLAEIRELIEPMTVRQRESLHYRINNVFGGPLAKPTGTPATVHMLRIEDFLLTKAFASVAEIAEAVFGSSENSKITRAHIFLRRMKDEGKICSIRVRDPETGSRIGVRTRHYDTPIMLDPVTLKENSANAELKKRMMVQVRKRDREEDRRERARAESARKAQEAREAAELTGLPARRKI